MIDLDYRKPSYYNWVSTTVKIHNTKIEYDLSTDNTDLEKEMNVLANGLGDLYHYSDMNEKEFFNLLSEYINFENIKYVEDDE